MEQDFDKDLKQRLDNASLPEAGVRFDKDKLWAKIENKKNRKRVSFLPWVSHAAAVAAGLAIGIFFFTRANNEEPDTTNVAVHQQEQPATAPTRDTVYLAKQESKKQSNNPKALPVTRHQQEQKPAQETVIANEKQPYPEKEEMPQPAPAPIFAAVQHKQTKVLHLSDMGNENANPKVWREKKSIFNVTQYNGNQSEQGTETVTALIAQKLKLTRN